MREMNIDAAVVWPNGKAYFFQEDQYVRYDVGADRADAGYPLKTSDHWPGLSFDRIDAAVVWPNGKAYFFRGSKYIRYDIAADRADSGYPLEIAGHWPGLFASGIDAALMGRRYAYFFKGDEYITYDVAQDRSVAGPRPWHPRWPGLAFDRIDAAINWGNGKAYFFRGAHYIRYSLSADRADPGYPLRIADHWPGLTSQTPMQTDEMPGSSDSLAGSVQPRLSFWQDLDATTYPVDRRTQTSEDRLGFANLATMQALRIQACAGSRYYGGTKFASIGPAGYRTGADIIEMIVRANRVTGRRIDRIHLFGHSGGDNGIYGEHREKRLGLYRSEFRQWRDTTNDPRERTAAKLVDELPKNLLADNLVVVLHGCKMATGIDNFARELFTFLSTGSPALAGVRIFGHRDSAAAEQNKDWIEFSAQHPTGTRTQMPAGIYRGFSATENAAVDAVNRQILKR